MLKGTLDDFTLPDIFRLMSLARKTGALEVQRSAGNGKVYFRDGEVYFAESSITRTPLGQKLVRSGVITETQLMKALDIHKERGQRLGDVLMAENLVDQDHLLEAVRSQIEDAAFDLLRWELGEFAWEPGAQIEPEVPIIVSVENLIMEASRRLDELEVILRKIPSEDAVLGMAAAPPVGAVEINITPEEWRILVQVNGERSVAEIAASLDVDTLDAMKSLYGMVSTGLIEVVGGVPEGWQPPEEGAAPTAEPELEAAASPFEPGAVSTEARQEGAPAGVVPEVVPEFTEQPPDRYDTAEVAAEQAPSDEVAVDAYDSPEPGELTTAVPADEEDLEGELLSDEPVERPTPAAEEVDREAEAELIREGAEPETQREAETDRAAAPQAGQGAEEESPGVDRIAAVRELAGLFHEEGEEKDARPAFRRDGGGEASTDEPDQRRRVEDDEQVTKALISKLISGVKDL